MFLGVIVAYCLYQNSVNGTIVIVLLDAIIELYSTFGDDTDT